MMFYLGTHKLAWLHRTDVPLFVSRLSFATRSKASGRSAPWALDSGGFTELHRHGAWNMTALEYVAEVRRITELVGCEPDFVAPQDWMCEPSARAASGLTVAEHQWRTVDNFLELRALAPDLPFVPVLQGWAPDEYLDCVTRYAAMGVDLELERLVGLGTVCRRQHAGIAERIVLSLRGLRLHAFGAKTGGLARYGYLLASADSLAWSYNARRMRARCELGSACTNHLHYALEWRDRTLRKLDVQQLHLEGVFT